MPKRPLDQDDVVQEKHQGEQQEGYMKNACSKERASVDEDMASMALATELFGDSPSEPQWSSVHYLAKMRLAPSLTLQSFLAHIQEQHPETTKPELATIWRRCKDFFVADNLKHATLKELMDMPSMIAAFDAASYVEASRSSGDSNLTNSDGGLGFVALAEMRYQFDQNFTAYQGLPWRLPSGSTMDDVAARLARQDGFESGLQSFVLEDPSKVIALFPAQEDKDELHRVLVERPQEDLATLTEHEQAFVDSFGKSPQEVKLMLGQGWANLPGGAELDVDFKMLVHHCFQQLYLTYRHFSFSLPKELKEAYYTDKVWGFMNVALDDVATLDHEPGEINSKTSGLRKNKDRTRPGRQVQGRKADGLVSTKGASHELCIVEAARKDQGPNGTKALDDTLKLIKGMKDMMDHIRASASENIRDQLVTYGIRISATTMTMYTMRQRPGRWYQMISHPPISLPTTWNEITGKRVSNVVSKLLGFKKDIMAMSVMVDQWTNEAVEDNGDRWVRTLTTPTSSPLLAPVSLPLQDIHTSPDESVTNNGNGGRIVSWLMDSAKEN
ncbi:MAG: hypothetical protein J3Q66DRAFT_382763 [Benniella sp.]|nr:MAG: hypothetical protein J3Q66DRAFT_382763 [Benniella sp.]